MRSTSTQEPIGVDRPPPARKAWRRLGLAAIFVLFLSSGIGHLFLTHLFVEITPDYVPWPREVVLVTGVCEIAGALGLLVSPFRRVAGVALALFALCVLPVHIDMLVHADQWPGLGLPLLWIRLLLQPILIWLILTVTNDAQRRKARIRLIPRDFRSAR